MTRVPWPYTNAPGDLSQEGAGRLTNVFVERRGDEQSITWRRAPGCTVFAREPSAGAAGGTAIALGISSVVDAQGGASGTSAAGGKS
jgi:hypothetical protein